MTCIEQLWSLGAQKMEDVKNRLGKRAAAMGPHRVRLQDPRCRAPLGAKWGVDSDPGVPGEYTSLHHQLNLKIWLWVSDGLHQQSRGVEKAKPCGSSLDRGRNDWRIPWGCAAAVMSCCAAQSCPTLSDPVGCSPPGSSAHGISQARIQEWVAISHSTQGMCTVLIGRRLLILDRWKRNNPYADLCKVNSNYLKLICTEC